MDDEAVVGGDDAAADPAGAEGTSDAPVDLQSIADDFDAQALADGDATPAGTEDGQGDGKGGNQPASTDPLDVFIQHNYNGDRNAMVNGIFESRAEAKRLAEENKELRSRLAPPPPARDVNAEVKSRFDNDPEVLAIDQEIKSTEARYKEIQVAQSKLGEEATTLSADINRLQGQLVHADDIERPKLLHDLGLKQNRLTAIEVKFENNNHALEGLQDRYKDKQRELQRQERRIRSEVESELTSESVTRRLTIQTRESFISSFDEAAKGYVSPDGTPLKPGTKAFNFMRESIRTQLRDFLDTQGDDADALDAAGISSAVSRLMAAAAESGYIRRAKSGGPAKPSTRITPRPTLIPRRPPVTTTDAARPPGTAPARATDDNFSNPDFIRRRADHILKAGASAVQPRGRGR